MDPVYICDMARFVSESDSKKVNHIYRHVGSISMAVKKKEVTTRKCYEGVRLPGHLSFPLMHTCHGLHLPNRLACYLHTQANPDAGMPVM